MNPRKTIIAILATLSASIALADDFKTASGKEYKDATVSRVEPDGIVVKTKSGISKIYFVELPKEVQARFGHDPDKIAAEKAAARAAEEKRIKQEKETERAEREKERETERAEREKEKETERARWEKEKETERAERERERKRDGASAVGERKREERRGCRTGARRFERTCYETSNCRNRDCTRSNGT